MAAAVLIRPSSPSRPGRAAASRDANVLSAHTREKIISVVTVETPDQSSAVAVALTVVPEALGCPGASSSC
jgi:hypothetical protein